MKLFKNAKKNNKGFSLVELIIVIAILAILVGIVGTQVIPYIEKSRIGKDQQELSGVLTNAVTAFSTNANDITGTTTIEVTGSGKTWTASSSVASVKTTFDELKGTNFELTSKLGSTISTITITYDVAAGTTTLETNCTGSENAKLYVTGSGLTD